MTPSVRELITRGGRVDLAEAIRLLFPVRPSFLTDEVMEQAARLTPDEALQMLAEEGNPLTRHLRATRPTITPYAAFLVDGIIREAVHRLPVLRCPDIFWLDLARMEFGIRRNGHLQSLAVYEDVAE